MIAEEFDATGAITDNTIKLLNANCSEIMSAYKAAKKILLRGSIESPISLRSPNNPRAPKDTDLNTQELADTFLKQLGFKAVRGNSIFVSSNITMARTYSRPTLNHPHKKTIYMIFPLNGFDYTWSDKVIDFYVHTPVAGSFLNYYPTAADFQRNFEYRSNNLVGGINSGNEIMISGKYYRIILNQHNYYRICKSLTIPKALGIDVYCSDKKTSS